MGPGPHGRGYIDGNGTPPASAYLNALWSFSRAGTIPPPRTLPAGASAPGATGDLPARPVTDAEMREQIRAWQVSAVVAVATRGSRLGRYLTALLGPPAVATGDVTAWRVPAR
jgi:hypothetical protein